jgi:hypothetical protein
MPQQTRGSDIQHENKEREMIDRLLAAREESELRLEVYKAINEERKRQDARWGVQDHDVAGVGESRRVFYQQILEEVKQANDQFVLAGIEHAWDSILLEEIYEAFGADNDDERITELVQVLAVGVEIIENIMRRIKTAKERKEEDGRQEG